MATTVSLNGTNYSIPATGDGSWGDSLSAYLVALSTGVLSKAGGTFTLTADANFGTNYGLKSPYFTSTASNPASAGAVRLASGDSIKWRNNANGADVALAKDSSDQLSWAGTSFLSSAGVLLAAGFPALTGDVTTSAGSLATALASTISGAKTFSTSLTSPAFISSTANAASAGTLRLANADTIKFRNAANSADIAFGVGSSDSFPAYGGVDLVTASGTQTLTNKTIDGDNNTVQDLPIAALKTVLADASKFLVRDASGIPTSSKAVPTGDVVGSSDTQSLTNKTIDADQNTISNIANAQIKAGAAIAVNKLAAVTASKVLVSDASGFVSASSVATTTLGYLDATSSIQTQLDGKQTTTLADGKILVGNGSNVATAVTPSGDVTFSNAGVTSIGAGVIANSHISGSAAIALSKLAAVTAGYIILGNGSNVPTATAVSGDVTINSSGVTAIAGGVIVDADISVAAAISRGKIVAGNGYRMLANDASGYMTENAALTASRNVRSDANGLLTTGAVTLSDSNDVTGTLPPANGGTGQNFSASTGVVKVASGTFSAGAAASDLSNGTTGTGSIVLAASPTVTGTLTAATVASSKAVTQGVATLTDGATVALDASLGGTFLLTAAGNRTISAPTNAVSGQKIVIAHKASGADRTLSLTTGSAGAFRFGTDITALTATTSGKTDYIGCIYNSADSRWDVVAYSKGY